MSLKDYLLVKLSPYEVKLQANLDDLVIVIKGKSGEVISQLFHTNVVTYIEYLQNLPVMIIKSNLIVS